MLDNSFDIPAYKFAIAKFKEDIGNDNGKLLEYIYNFDYSVPLIPFEDVDGLMLNELKSLLNIDHNHFVLVCYSSFEDGGHVKKLFNRILFFRVNEDESIDKAIENNMLKSFDNLDDIGKKVVCCFLERYQTKNTEEVRKRIRKYRQENNK